MTEIATTPNPLSNDFLHNPYRYFSQLRDEHPALYLPEADGYFISRYQDVRAALHDERFTTAPLTVRAEPVMRGRVLAQMRGTEHTAKRKIVIRGIVGKDLRQRYGPMIRRNAYELVEPHLRKGSVDLVNDFGKQFAVYVTLDLLGLPKSDWSDIARWHHGVADFITSVVLTPEQREHSLRCSEQLAEYLAPIIEDKRKRPDNDYMSALCAAEVDGVQMSTSDITALCMNILLAATEPADKTLALLFRHLLEHPEQLKRVRRDRSLLSKAIAETLRYTPPVQLIPRQAEEDVDIAGRHVPSGSLVFCLIGAANHDPAAFVEPDRFDIDRTDLDAVRSFSAAANHLAFGSGMHYCVGAAFARIEVEEVADLLLDLMENVSYSAGFHYSESGLYTRGPSALQLDFDASLPAIGASPTAMTGELA